ncbi:MAG TPA: family 20 glycosylhydrolase [Flavobacteriales bacterium]|jgi:hexosaminidase|nr:family 20 glycosylhydrolase [Flavobacteriales bacterium]
MRFLSILLLLSVNVSAQQGVLPSIIPAPVEMRLTDGSIDLQCPFLVEGGAPIGPGLVELVRMDVDRSVSTSFQECMEPNVVSLALIRPDTLLPPEWYSLSVTAKTITINAVEEAGLFRGSRTLIQLLQQGLTTGSLSCLTISDHPRFPWRGMHLDVCRHFFPVEFVKKYIDLLARYKMNSFHWHLTEDQGWRMEIKSHPNLTEVGAWRKGSQVGPYSRREYDSIPYGGFYTQDEIREVVAYAAARHINVVPEIELPGHAMAALAAYPHLGCTGGPYEVQKGWGVFEDVFCAGNDSTFAMLEDVLTEVMDLFPSPYIHIGGDECPKEAWKSCSKCQARKKAEGLKDEHELQSWFIQRIEKFVNAKGRKIIGWDEILEGGLAPNAAVMSWQGIEGGIAAARSGHYAVMSPGSHCYFDHYQGDPANEPLAIGGYTTVQKVYSYEPIPAELKPEEHKYILGAQGNVWTEYILTPEHVEYMAVPRMLALAEVLWTPKEKRNEADFIARLEREFPMLETMKVNASKSLYQVSIRPEQGPKPGSIAVGMTLATGGSFSMTELQPTFDKTTARLGVYTGPVIIDSDRELHGWLQREGLTGPISKRRFFFNKATAQKITLSTPPNERYNDGGAFTLVDGITAQEKRVNTEWLGWREGVTITVDLGSEQDVRTAGIGALNETYSWIHMPEQVEFSTSNDGKTFVSQGSVKARPGVGRNAYKFDLVTRTRYIRITVKHPGKIPEGFPGAGSAAWMFLDEIEVR